MKSGIYKVDGAEAMLARFGGNIIMTAGTLNDDPAPTLLISEFASDDDHAIGDLISKEEWEHSIETLNQRPFVALSFDDSRSVDVIIDKLTLIKSLLKQKEQSK